MFFIAAHHAQNWLPSDLKLTNLTTSSKNLWKLFYSRML